ncbi:MAG: DUF368 domain-containing protein [Verrucomicrobiota bacterium]
MKDWSASLSIFAKGAAMGAANVIPGVSGGTVAFITGIYERLIFALKSFNVEARTLLKDRKWADFVRHTDLKFLFLLLAGSLASILTLAKILKWAFSHHENVVWAFFFGLIAASIPAVGKMVRHWKLSSILCLLAGLAVAVAMAFLGRADENTSFLYLLLCGVIAVCSMIIPGLSGSFVLLLLGNYELVMVDAVNLLRSDPMGAMAILIPVGIGAVIGLISLARLLSWLFANVHDQAVSLITGFIAGSLAVIWPWKDPVRETFLSDSGKEKVKITGFENWHVPDLSQGQTWLAIGIMILGGILVWLMERSAPTKAV